MGDTGPKEAEFSIVATTTRLNPLLEQFNLAEYTYNDVKTVICKTCRIICFPDHVAGHVKSKHMFAQAELKRSGLLTHLKGRRWATAEQINTLVGYLVLSRPRPLEPFENTHGWQCRYCSRCYRTKFSLSTHISASCSKRPPKDIPGTSLASLVNCQKILGTKHGTIIRVYPRPVDQPTVKIGLKELEFLRDRRVQQFDLVDSDPTCKSDPWLAMTGWLTFCGGDSRFVASTLCPLTAARGRGVILEHIAAATKSLLCKSLSYIGETSSSYRRKLESPRQNRSLDLFGCQRVKTQMAYTDIFVRMVLYICSLSLQEISVIRKTEVSFEEFRDDIQLVVSLAGRTDDEQSGHRIETAILALIVRCLTFKIPANTSSRFRHPVINFLAVEGFDEKNGKWRDARHTTPYFAAMSFCARLCILASSWKTAQSSEGLDNASGNSIAGVRGGRREELDSSDEDEYEEGVQNEGEDIWETQSSLSDNRGKAAERMVTHRFQIIFDQLLEATKDGSDYPMSEWMAQHAYGKAISDNSLLRGHIYWNGDETTLFHNGERFDLLKYRGFIGMIPKKINDILKKMMFVDLLPIIPLKKVFDNPSNYIPGYGLRNEPRNSEWVRFCLLLHILQTPELRKEFYPNGSDTLCRVAMSWYLELNLELQLWFAIALLLVSGGPPRGTEILALLKYNTPTQRRNVFVVDGEVMILSMYNKTQGLTGHASPIYRFLPTVIGEQLVLYLFHVEPLADLFQHRLTNPTSGVKGGPSPLLFTPFERDCRPWNTPMISDFLKQATISAMDFPLQLNNYRQIIAAIARTHVQEMADIIDRHLEQAKSKLVEQFGHSYQTNINHYGNTDSRIPETEEISMKQFRRATMYYQFFLGAIPALPQWMIQPSIIFHASVNGLTTHPSFRHPAFPKVFMQVVQIPEISQYSA